MRRKLILAALLLIVMPLSLFAEDSKAGRWFTSVRPGFNVTAVSWASDSRTTLAPNARWAVIGKFSAGYQLNDWFRLGGTTGFAWQFAKDSTYNGYMYIPFTVDTDFRLAKLGPVDLWAQVSLGGYDRIVGNRFQLGPMAALGLYAEYAINDDFLIGAGTGVTAFMTFFKGGSEILFEVNPVYLICTYML